MTVESQPVVDRAPTPELVRLEVTDRRWAEFVDWHPDATPFHLPAWGQAVAGCYRLPLFALALVDPSGAIVGGLPVVAVRHRPGRTRWVTLPFTDHCPPLTSGAAVETALCQRIGEQLAASHVQRLVVRADLPAASWTNVAVRHVLVLDRDPELTFARFHRSQVIRNIRRAEREGVTVRVGTDRTDLTDVFYRLHRSTRRRQGVPVQPRRFFELVWDHVLAAGHGSVLIAEHRGVPVAAAVFLRHNGTVVYKYGASDAEAWNVRPNHALFRDAIRRACLDGDTIFDWGRTDFDNPGLRAFKSAWGAQELPLAHSTIDPAGHVTRPAADAAGPVAVRVAAGRATAVRMAGSVVRNGPPWVCSALGTALYRFTA